MADGPSPISSDRRSSRNRNRVCKRCKFSTSDSIAFLHHLSAHDQQENTADDTDSDKQISPAKIADNLEGEGRTQRRSSSSHSRRQSTEDHLDMNDDSNNNLGSKAEGDDDTAAHGLDYPDDVAGLKDYYRAKLRETEAFTAGDLPDHRRGRTPSPVPSPTEYPRGAFTSPGSSMSGGSVSVRGEAELNGGAMKAKSLYGGYQGFFNEDVDINQNTDRKAALNKDVGFASMIKPPEIPGGMRLSVNNPSPSQKPPTKSPASGAKGRTGCAPIREAVDPAKYVTIREPDGTKYACSKCGNIYKWRKSLNKHWKEKHEGEIPDPRPNLTQINIPRFTAKNEISLPSSVQRGLPFGGGAQGLKMAHDLGSSAPTITGHLSRPTIPDLGELYQFSDRFANFERKMAGADRMPRDNRMQRRSAPYPTPGREQMMSSGRHSTGAPSHARGMKHSPNYPQKPAAYTKTPGLELPVFTHADYMNDTRRRSPSPKRDFPREDAEVLDLSKKGAHLAPPPRVKMETSSMPPQDEPLDFSMKPSSGGSSETREGQSAFQKFVRPEFTSSRREDEMDFTSFQGEQSSTLGLECSSCAYIARDKQDYENHMELHLRKRHHKCAECQQVFFSLEELNRHFLRQHIDIVQSKLHGTSPDGSPGKQSELYRHLTIDSKQLLTCMVCSAIYQWQWTLAKHFDEDHPSIPNPYGKKGQRTQPGGEYEDEYDGERSTHSSEQGDQSSSGVARHQLKHSINRSPLICKLCGFSTRWREELAQHQLEEHNVNPMDMADDGEEPMMSFIAPGTGQVIDLTAEDTAIVIPQAPEDTAMMERGDKNRPRKPGSSSSSSAETLLPFKCSVCEYRARWPSEITQHMKNHSDEKPYLCPRCSYRSKWKWDVVKHLKRCGGGTVKDVIDTTKQRKQQEVKALLADVLPPSPGAKNNGPGSFIPTNAREVLSNGPPNVTVTRNLPTTIRAEDLEMDEHNFSTNSNSSYSDRGLSPSNISPSAKRLSGGKSQVRGLVNHGQHFCLQCPFVGNSPAELKRHSRVHSDAKPFICKTCGYCSKWKCDLKKHLKTYNHTSAVPLVYGGHGRKPADWYEKSDERGEGEGEEDGPLDSDLFKSSDDSAKGSSSGEPPRTPTKVKSSKLKCKQCEFEADDLSSFLQHKLSHSSQGGSDTPTHGERDGRSVTPSNMSESELTASSSQTKHRRKASTQHRIIPTAQDVFEDSDDDQDGANYADEMEVDSDGPIDFTDRKQHSVGIVAPVAPMPPMDAMPPMPPLITKGSKVPNYQCDLCAYTTDNKSNFEKHNRCHNASNRYPCEWCNWSTNTLNLLYRHAQTVHANELAQQEKDAFYGKIKMGGKRPSTDSPSEEIERGSEGGTDTPPPRFGTSKRRRRLKTCKKCGYVTDNVTTLQRHMAKHGSNGKFTCEQCDYSVDRLHVLQYHVKIVHDATTAQERIAASLGAPVKSPKLEDGESMSEIEETSMVDTDKEPMDDDTDFRDTADEAGAASSGEDTDVYNSEKDKAGDGDKSRVSARAVGARRYRCHLCTFYTASRGSLKRHRVLHRIIGYKLKCEQCDFHGTMSENLRLHVRKQHKRRTTRPRGQSQSKRCESCPFKTDSARNLRNHSRHHSCGLEYACDFCDFSAGTKDQILGHRKLHRCEPEYSNNYQPPKSETGDGDALSGRNTRRRSARMVEDEADCMECPYQTRSISLLRTHQTYHDQQARYVCDMCTFSSPKASQVQTHRLVHKEEDGFLNYKSKRSLLNDDYCASLYANRVLGSIGEIPGIAKVIKKYSDAVKDARKGGYVCKICPFSCGGKQVLAAHNKQHQMGGNYKCPECSFGIDRFGVYCIHAGLHLSKSQQTLITRVKTRRCPRCLFCSRNRALMKLHLRKHSNKN